jgi:hypothetical protein
MTASHGRPRPNDIGSEVRFVVDDGTSSAHYATNGCNSAADRPNDRLHSKRGRKTQVQARVDADLDPRPAPAGAEVRIVCSLRLNTAFPQAGRPGDGNRTPAFGRLSLHTPFKRPHGVSQSMP